MVIKSKPSWYCTNPDCWCRDPRFIDEPDNIADEIRSLSEAEIHQAIQDAGRDPNAIVERALKLIEEKTS